VVTNNTPYESTPHESSSAVQQAFADFDRALNLDPDERREAQEFHNKLTDFLKSKGVIKNAFLQGSFARKTMLSPVRDIDKVIILDDRYVDLQAQTNGSENAADLVERTLRERYPDAVYGRSRHAIQMDLGEDTFSFDVVPAFEIHGDTDDVMIMDRERVPWKRSNTRTLIEVVAERNAECEGAFVHQVRYVKHWARTHLGERLPGLHVEAIAFACIGEKLDNADAAWHVFDCGAKLLGTAGSYTDPTGVDNLASKLSDVDCEFARRAFDTAAATSSAALALDRAGRSDEAVAAWASIFIDPSDESGPRFGSQGPTGGNFLRGLALGASVAGGTSKSASATTPTRSWSPW
jgi:hypothetical protein